MIVLGFDPGTASTGWGVIEQDGNRLKSLGHGCIVTSAKDETHVRLRKIHDEARLLIKRFKPDIVVLEELFVNVNVRTALAVGQAKGVLYLAASDLAAAPREYSPLQIKLAVTGYGRASKVQVQEMTKVILGLSRIPQPDHAADALAVAITHTHHNSDGVHRCVAPPQEEGPVIASVRGTLLLVDGERAVVDVGGIGLEVLASGRTLATLAGGLGKEVSLHTYLHVREDALQLFGFRAVDERAFFLWLIAVSGVGPKVALAVLSGYPVADLELAVARDDVKKFESIPGIGKKLAQRLVVELKDKVGGLPSAAVAAGPATVAGGAFLEARSALQNLGLSLREAEQALRGAPDDAPVEELVKYALAHDKDGT